MSKDFWRKLCDCLYMNKMHSFRKTSRYNFKIKQFLFKEKPFEGIIDYLTKINGNKNVADSQIVKVTASSVDDPKTEQERNVVDLNNEYNYYGSKNEEITWLQYDFGERRVRPTHYSIRTRHHWDGWYLRNWVIEGSNSGKDDDWEQLDNRQNDECLYRVIATHTYNISNEFYHMDESYKYLRIRVTGKNTSGTYHLLLSALEFFGELIEK